MIKLFCLVFFNLLIYTSSLPSSSEMGRFLSRRGGIQKTCTACGEIRTKLDEIIQKKVDFDALNVNLLGILNLQNIDLTDVLLVLNSIMQQVDASSDILTNTVDTMIEIVNDIPINVDNYQDTVNDNDNFSQVDADTDNDNVLDSDTYQDNDDFDNDDFDIIYFG